MRVRFYGDFVATYEKAFFYDEYVAEPANYVSLAIFE